MSDTSTRPCGDSRRLDPRKRVNYTTGLVLGADEFVQEQTYLRARDHLGVRALHGYGTVSGLEVRWHPETGQIRVAPGLAVDPAGRLVCVPTEQCADLARWLTEHRDEIVDGADGDDGDDGDDDELPGDLALYVVLCYRECQTDTVPVPSESCRSADESMAASRIMDSFELRLVLAPPGSAGELAGDALAEAVERLLGIAAAVGGAGEDGDGEDDGDDDEGDGDDGDDGDGDAAGEVDADAVRRELIAWATTQRPELPDSSCLEAPDDDCGDRTDEPSTAVLLARVDLGLADDDEGGITPVDPEVDENERPVLLSTRFLQEWLTGLVEHPELFAPGDHSVLENLEADDHPQYLLVDGSRPLTGTLNAGHNVILNLRRSNGPTHAMRRDEIIGLDLDRTSDGLRLAAIQGEPIEASGDDAPDEGDVLRYDGERWVPAPLAAPEEPSPVPDDPSPVPDDPVPSSETPVRSVRPLATIELLGRSEEGASFLVWFHFEGPDASAVLAPLDDEQPIVYGRNFDVRTEACPDGRLRLTRVRSDRVAVRQVACNRFRVDINRQEAEFLRFEFHLDGLLLDSGETVEEFGEGRGIRWVGQSEPQLVTNFVVNPSPARPIDGFEHIDHVVVPGGGSRLPVERR